MPHQWGANWISLTSSETTTDAMKEENERGISFYPSQHFKRHMQTHKASGKVEKGITETTAPCPSTNSPEAVHVDSPGWHSRKAEDWKTYKEGTFRWWEEWAASLPRENQGNLPYQQNIGQEWTRSTVSSAQLKTRRRSAAVTAACFWYGLLLGLRWHEAAWSKTTVYKQDYSDTALCRSEGVESASPNCCSCAEISANQILNPHAALRAAIGSYSSSVAAAPRVSLQLPDVPGQMQQERSRPPV